jgi:hypothetical protein
MKTAYRVPRDVFGPSNFESQDTDHNSPITAIRINSLFVEPAPGATLAIGRQYEILGIAWDGGAGVRRVEWSLDGGLNWREATLGRDSGRYSWRQWRFRFKPARAGLYTLLARAQSRDGSMQSDVLTPNPAGYHHNVVQRVEYHAS